jgi:FixJ family two-component response regulator
MAMQEQSGKAHCGKAVAIVDDDPAVRSSLKFSLEIEGYEVRTFGDAIELLSDLSIVHYGCMIIDQKLPIIDGLELVARLRARSVATPVILITSHPSVSVRLRAWQAGIPIVEKPLLGNALVNRIQLLFDSAV